MVMVILRDAATVTAAEATAAAIEVAPHWWVGAAAVSTDVRVAYERLPWETEVEAEPEVVT